MNGEDEPDMDVQIHNPHAVATRFNTCVVSTNEVMGSKDNGGNGVNGRIATAVVSYAWTLKCRHAVHEHAAGCWTTCPSSGQALVVPAKEPFVLGETVLQHHLSEL